jgi:hypothetical protein
VTIVHAPWATASDVPEHLTAELTEAGAGEDIVDAALEAASDILFHLTGARWLGGTASSTFRVRPRSSLIALPHYAVTEVTEVRDWTGTVVPADRYRLTGRWVERYRVDSRGRDVALRWEAGEHAVTYLHGAPPPPAGVAAAAELGAQIALQRLGSGRCRLPARVSTVSRQGVTVAVLDPLEHLDKGLTGLPDVDVWVASVNPGRLRRRPRVWSPDTSRLGRSITPS